MKFNKTALTVEQQIDLLKSRNLIIGNEKRAIRKLSFIGYYRLSAYFKFFQRNDVFVDDIDFERPLELYVFDRKLRLLFFDAIERIEVSLRTFLVLFFSHEFGNTWYLNPDLFHGGFDFDQHKEFIEKRIEKSRNNTVFLKIFFEKYKKEKYPPAWMFLECLTFGDVFRIFRGLKRPYRKQIAQNYQLNEKVLSSWLWGILDIRNNCAHHGRLWNKEVRRPISRKSDPFVHGGRIYDYILITLYFLRILSPHSTWKKSVKDLLEKFPDISERSMGFPENWTGLFEDLS